MGTYITHEGLPFHGNLKKIRIRSCRATDPSLPGFDEEQLLEITQNGEVKLTQKTPTGTEKTKTRISQADADHIFAAFSEVFASYRRERTPSVSGHWRVRLLTDDNEVYFYHGANGQDYRYRDESLTDILRQRTGMPGLFGLSVKAETKSKVKSIEISLEQTAADEVKDRYANEYGICMHDTTEWLLISSEGTITYNRRVANVGRVSLQYELKDKVAEFLKVYNDQSVFSHPKGHSPDTVQDEVRKTYKIVVTRDSGDTSVLEGSFDEVAESGEETASDDVEIHETPEEYCNRIVKEDGYLSAVPNTDGSVTLTMTKAKRSEMMAEMKQSIDDNIQKSIGDDGFQSIKEVTYNDDVTEFTVKVDREAFEGSWDGLSALTYAFCGAAYQYYSGVSDPRVVVNYIDADTGEVISTSTYPDDYQDLLGDSVTEEDASSD